METYSRESSYARLCKATNKRLGEYNMRNEYPQIISECLKEKAIDYSEFIGRSENGKFTMEVHSCPSWKTSMNKFNRHGYALYFKVFISHKIKKAQYNFILQNSTKMYRVSMLSPQYITADDNGEKGYMSEEEISEMIKILNENAYKQKYSNWVRIIKTINWDHDGDYPFKNMQYKPISEDYAMPDYTKLQKRVKPKYHKHSGFIVFSYRGIYISTVMDYCRKDFADNPYFRLYNASNPVEATAVARIYIHKAAYAKNSHGQAKFILSKFDLEELIDALNSSDDDDEKNTVWNKLLVSLENMTHRDFVGTPMPDYTKLPTRD
jgi:hypothetical protein